MRNLKRNILGLLVISAFVISSEINATVLVFTSLHDFHKYSGSIIYHTEAPETQLFAGGFNTPKPAVFHFYVSFA